VKDRLRRLLHVPFRFDYSGSQIIFFDQEADYAAEEWVRRNHRIATFRELSELERREER
jgi:D-glycero-alpha-D-manno-heptose-7-phosphate kinase